MIIFEGADCTGKTRLIQELQSWLATQQGMGTRVRHHGPYKQSINSVAHHYRYSIECAMDHRNKITFLDRSWLSEYPYSVLFRGVKPRLTELAHAQLELGAAELKAVVVYCLPSEPVAACNMFLKRKVAGEEIELSQLRWHMINAAFALGFCRSKGFNFAEKTFVPGVDAVSSDAKAMVLQHEDDQTPVLPITKLPCLAYDMFDMAKQINGGMHKRDYLGRLWHDITSVMYAKYKRI